MPQDENHRELPLPVRADVQMQPSAVTPTPDQALWSAIRNRTDAISFNRYADFINRVLCAKTDEGIAALHGGSNTPGKAKVSEMGAPSIGESLEDLENRPSIYGVDTYQLLKLGTQAFLLFESGIVVAGRRDPKSGAIPTPDGRRPEWQA